MSVENWMDEGDKKNVMGYGWYVKRSEKKEEKSNVDRLLQQRNNPFTFWISLAEMKKKLASIHRVNDGSSMKKVSKKCFN